MPKPFRGSTAMRQRNAIASWAALTPRPDVILFGDDEGTAEAARDLGVRHVPEIGRNEFGTPLVDDLFARAAREGTGRTLVYCNADIILLPDFPVAIERVAASRSRFLVVGRRWNLDLARPLDFSALNWQVDLRGEVMKAGEQCNANFVDYFAFSRGLFDGMLSLPVGRPYYDNYLVWLARSRGAGVVDASAAVMAIHQNHDYSHHPQGSNGVFMGPEAKRSRALVGGWWHLYTIEDATHMVTADGGIRRLHRHPWLMAKRLWSHPLTIVQLPWLALKRAFGS
ncbi:MAG: hypothetical protein ABSA32_01440 [Candidatus Acidiferrales bacterium]|jgi:hypothetical protein